MNSRLIFRYQVKMILKRSGTPTEIIWNEEFKLLWDPLENAPPPDYLVRICFTRLFRSCSKLFTGVEDTGL